MCSVEVGIDIKWLCVHNIEVGQLGHRNKSKRKYLTIPCLVEGLLEQNLVQIASRHHFCAVIVDSKPFTIRQSQQDSFNNKEQPDFVFIVVTTTIYANIEVLSEKK